MPTTPTAPVLVVDDDAAIRFLLESILTDQGYPVLTAGNGREALDAIEQQPPALVLLDLHMPVLAGWETLAAIRAKQWSFPVIFLSGGINAAVQATAHNADGYLAKPLNLDVVVETVHSFLPPAARETAARARVAIIGFAGELALRLEEIVREAGCIPLTTQPDWVGETPAALQAFLDRHHAAVLLYNICPPYPDHWALFAAVRAAEHKTGTGRRFVALTADKQALQELVGPTPALALDAEQPDPAVIIETLREVAAG
jgi:two-component system chemotaxis response regulator CheY